MYKLHLILKYLRKRRIAWVSLIAVMLCTAMVLIVISVMGGWLRMFRESFHGLSGDVLVRSRSISGFSHYEEMIKRIEQLPEVKAAVPTIRTYGVINVRNRVQDAVQVIGYPIDRIGQVNRFHESLYRQHERPLSQGLPPPPPSFDLPAGIDYKELVPGAIRDVTRWPGMIVGGGVIGIKKDKTGQVYRYPRLYDDWIFWATLNVMPISDDGDSLASATPTPGHYWIVDDSRTQLWQYDSKTVYVPFEKLQYDLDMAARDGQPARTTDIEIAVHPGHNLMAVRAKVETAVNQVLQEMRIPLSYPIIVETWEQSQAMFISAIEKEVVLVTILFGIISIVAIFLIFCIFYMIVVEKTKDIGIIKAVGATNGGVAGIFLGYGLAIGIVGSGLGLLMSWLIVNNINYLHDQIAEKLGLTMWDPEVYAFDNIPSTMDPKTVIIIVAVAIIASVAGALVPAWRAARLHPVESLRWE
jgi:lipoprotein-releasing system permease protein